MTVGEKIKMVRESKGMSQEELAIKMGYKDRSSISKIEKNNDDNIAMDTVQKAAEILNCSPLYLMGWEEKDASQDTSRLAAFTELYSSLTDEQKTLIDNMLKALTSKQ